MYWTFNQSNNNCNSNILTTSPSNGNITGSYSLTDGCSSTVAGVTTTGNPFVQVNSAGNAIQNYIAEGGTEYWYFTLSGSNLANLSDINVYFQITKTKARDENTQIDYSIDGGTNYFGAKDFNISKTNDWYALNFDFSGISGINSSLIFRISWSQNTGGGTRDNYVTIDNFQVQGIINLTSEFEVSTSDPVAVCNAAIDTVNALANTTYVDFVVDMTTGGSNWSPLWEVTFTIGAGTGFSIIGTVSSTDGLLTDNGGGSYTLTNVASTNGTGSAIISVAVAGGAFIELAAVLTLTAAKELDYNISDSDSGNWLATATINPIPATSNIVTD